MSGKFRPARKAQRSGHCLNERLGEIIVPVKMQVTRDRTENPVELYCSLILNVGTACTG